MSVDVNPATAQVRGDGTTTGSRARSRWSRARWPLVVAVVVLVGGLLASAIPARTSTVPLAPDNPGTGGARALAEILRDQGVQIEYVRTLGEAASRAGAGTTLLVAGTNAMYREQVLRLREIAADLVLVGPAAYHVAPATGDALETSNRSSAGLPPASCADPDARAAEAVSSGEYSVMAATDDATVCFLAAGSPPAGAYGVVREGERRVVVIPDASLMTNEYLAENGNAALLLRSLGHHELLVWYVPSFGDTGTDEPGRGAGVLPPWFGVLGLQLGVLVLALALWRGRRLGPVVTEPLPVLVQASETAYGRGRLYRKARSWGRAAAALRAGTARRTAIRLGLPRTAGATDVIDALARATGRSTEQVAGLLYGPPPTDDAGLAQLARSLDDLESEVHRK